MLITIVLSVHQVVINIQISLKTQFYLFDIGTTRVQGRVMSKHVDVIVDVKRKVIHVHDEKQRAEN